MNMGGRAARVACLVLSITMTSLVIEPTLALAQAPASADAQARAKKLKAEADKAMDDIQYADALKKYSQAFELTHDPALIYNRARAYGALNQYPEAAAELERFTREAPADLKAKVPGLDALLTEFHNHVSTVSITCNVPAQILLRDLSVGTCPTDKPLVVNAGPASITISAVDYITQKKDVTLTPAGAQTIDFKLEKQNPTTILVVHSAPSTALTSVDGKSAGATPRFPCRVRCASTSKNGAKSRFRCPISKGRAANRSRRAWRVFICCNSSKSARGTRVFSR